MSKKKLLSELMKLREQIRLCEDEGSDQCIKLVKIKEKLELFKTVIEKSKEAIAISDAQGNLVYINPAHEKLFGRTLQEAQNMNYRDYYPPDSLRILNTIVAPALTRGETWEGELDVYDYRGRKFPLWEQAGSIVDDQGNFLYGFGFMHDISEKKQIIRVLRTSEERYRELINNMSSGVAVYEITPDHEDFIFKEFNKAAERIEHVKKESLIGKKVTEVFPGVISFGLLDVFKEVYKTGKPKLHPISFYQDNKHVGWRENYVYKLPSGEIVAVYDDVTEMMQAQEREKLYAMILEILNNSGDMKSTIELILQKIKEFTGFEAIGIRLQEGRDFPYFVTTGFSRDFVEAERYLCSKECGEMCVEHPEIHPYLECMCGNVIRGRTDPELPFFSAGGSFWSNNTTELLSRTTEEERQSRTRNMCNSMGYESVALIPLRFQDKIIGLIQFNDHKKDRFTLESITFFEKIGSSIGIAFARIHDQQRLRKSLAEKEVLIQEIHHRVKNNLQVISSLIGLQMLKLKNVNSLNAFTDIKNRIYTMSLLHQILYQTKDITQINMARFIKDIILYLIQSLRADPDKIQIDYNIKEVHLNIDKALPCGLIINEIASNSIKYAFCEQKKGIMSITMIQENEYIVLEMEDNGPGLPERINSDTTQSLGLSLISSFTDQLDGSMTLTRDHGTHYRIKFPIIDY